MDIKKELGSLKDFYHNLSNRKRYKLVNLYVVVTRGVVRTMKRELRNLTLASLASLYFFGCGGNPDTKAASTLIYPDSGVTDTRNVDTDGDGYTDQVEIRAGTDPTNPYDFPSEDREDSGTSPSLDGGSADVYIPPVTDPDAGNPDPLECMPGMNTAPIARFAHPERIDPLETITFDASQSYDPDCSPRPTICCNEGIEGYIWDFGDGSETSSNTPFANHQFPMSENDAIYPVSLTVHDAYGVQSTKTENVNVLGRVTNRSPVCNAGPDLVLEDSVFYCFNFGCTPERLRIVCGSNPNYAPGHSADGMPGNFDPDGDDIRYKTYPDFEHQQRGRSEACEERRYIKSFSDFYIFRIELDDGNGASCFDENNIIVIDRTR